MSDELQAVGLCLEGRYILLADDRTLPIVLMIDITGEETDDPKKCVGIVFQRPDGMYGVHDAREFTEEYRIKANA